MKYMGNKRVLLEKGLGAMLLREAKSADRLVDLFSGSGAVASYVVEAVPIPALAVDLQQYAVCLAGSVIARTEPVSETAVRSRWLDAAEVARSSDPRWVEYEKAAYRRVTATSVKRARRVARDGPSDSIVRAYGGHYFSLSQALTLDHMLATAPKRGELATLCSATLIRTASRCAAAPGHTAQPFQPTPRAIPYIKAAWVKDPLEVAQAVVEDLAPRHALTKGAAKRADAISVARRLGPGDLAVVDPPYSAVQYSRFYHVLESLARGTVGEVSGVGRYASFAERPRSDFSLKTKAREACGVLLDALAEARCRVVFTFPAGQCSNGLSGDELIEMADARFRVKAVAVNGRFSTLGGNGDGRPSRHASEELILTMSPRRRKSTGRARVSDPARGK